MRTTISAALMLVAVGCGGNGEFTPATVEPSEDPEMICYKCAAQDRGLQYGEDAGACATARATVTSWGVDASFCY